MSTECEKLFNKTFFNEKQSIAVLITKRNTKWSIKYN